MKHALLTTLLAIVFMTSLRADASLDHARQAQALLGPEVWSRVIRIENFSRRSLYPATVYALVFEFDARLWFYTDTNGTQSFSNRRGPPEEDRANFQPLLREIDPGFGAYTILESSEWVKSDESLPNGCFIESLAKAHELAGDPATVVTKADLLSLYVGRGPSLRGHTVLAYETPKAPTSTIRPSPAAKFGSDRPCPAKS